MVWPTKCPKRLRKSGGLRQAFGVVGPGSFGIPGGGSFSAQPCAPEVQSREAVVHPEWCCFGNSYASHRKVTVPDSLLREKIAVITVF